METNNIQYVHATDKFLSGWGHAKDKTNIIIIKCDDEKEVQTVLQTIEERPEIIRPVVSDTKNKKYYNNPNYYVQEKCKYEMPLWFKIKEFEEKPEECICAEDSDINI